MVGRWNFPHARIRPSGDVDSRNSSALGARKNILESTGARRTASGRHGSGDSADASNRRSDDTQHDGAHDGRNDSATRDKLADSAHSGSAGGTRPGREEVAQN